jgi:hypothetical protein
MKRLDEDLKVEDNKMLSRTYEGKKKYHVQTTNTTSFMWYKYMRNNMLNLVQTKKIKERKEQSISVAKIKQYCSLASLISADCRMCQKTQNS